MSILEIVYKERMLKELTKRLEVKDKVLFVGSREPREISQWMNASDIFVLPSLSEGRPNVVAEAMASGLAVVATDVGGTGEFIGNDINGILIKPKDPEEIADKIISLLEDDKKRMYIGKKARKAIVDNGLTWDMSADEYIKIYRYVM